MLELSTNFKGENKNKIIFVDVVCIDPGETMYTSRQMEGFNYLQTVRKPHVHYSMLCNNFSIVCQAY